MAAANQYDRMNDPELGSGIYTDVILDLGDAMNELKQLDPAWATWFDATIPNDATYEQIYPIVKDRVEAEKAEAWKALGILAEFIPPEPKFVDDWCLQLEDWPGELGESPTELRSLYGYG